MALLSPVVIYSGLLFVRSTSKPQTDEIMEETCQLDPKLHYYGGESDDITVSVGIIWTLYTVQPVVEEIINKDGIQYLVGKLPDTANNCVRVKFIMTGSLPIEDHSGFTQNFTLNYYGQDKKSAEEFRDSIKVGEQISIKYLAVAPDRSLLTDEFCSQQGNNSEYYCALQKIHNDYLRYERIDPLGPGNINSYPVIYGANFNYNLRVIGSE